VALDIDDFGERSLRTLRLWGGTLFFFSGLTGLIYQVLWTRRLNLTFGHSILAVSTVVTAYMGGLALGSALGGRWSDRHLRASQKASWFLARYGHLEAFIGIWALLSLPLLDGVEWFYLTMSSRGVEGSSLHLLAFLASALVLLPPTTAMGATLPLLSCLYNNHPAGLGKTLARLYSTNTFGAVVGVALAGFLFLPVLGFKVSMALSAALNLLIGATAATVSRRLQGRLRSETLVERPSVVPASLLLPLGFAITGALSMVFQVGWTRSLSLSLGCSVYAFSSILLVFLGGITLGSAFYARRKTSTRPDFGHLSVVFAGIGLSGAMAIFLLGYLPLAFVRFFPYVSDHYWQVLLLDLALCCVVLIVPTWLMGLSFPMVTQLYHDSSSGQLGQSVGNIYGANTLGCIVGSFAAGFVLIPSLGVQRSLQLAACGFFWVAAIYAYQSRKSVARFAAAILLLLGPTSVFLPNWDSALMSAGVATHASGKLSLDNFVRHQPMFYGDGISGSVAILCWAPGGLTLRVNGKPESSLAVPDRLDQTLLGLLPHFYVRDPKHVGVIGLGSGLTLRALAGSKKVESAICAELEPLVIETDRYWAPYNGQILADPRVKARYADGRTMIMGSDRPFDALVSVPSNPWIAGIGNLYTQDFYQSVRDKLNPGGVYLQWVNLYAISPADLQIILRTFHSVFPEAQLWAIGGDIALIGGNGRASRDLMQDYYREALWLRLELAEIGFSSVDQLVGSYLCPLATAVEHIPAGPLNTDDNPILEYSAPFSMYSGESYSKNLHWMYSMRQAYSRGPDGIELDAQSDLSASLGSMAFPQSPTPRLLTISGPSEPFRELFDLMKSRGDFDDKQHRRRLDWISRYPAWEEGRATLAHNALIFDYFQHALDYCPSQQAIAAMDEVRRYMWLRIRATSNFGVGHWQSALDDYRALSQFRQFCDFDSAAAYCCWRLKDWEGAQGFVEKTLAANPYEPQARMVQGLLLHRQGRAQEALKVLAEVCHDCPRLRDSWITRARILAGSGRRAETGKVIEEYLMFFPEDQQMRSLQQQLKE